MGVPHGRVVPHEGRPPGEALIEDGPQRIDVGPVIGPPWIDELLGRQVVRAPQLLAGAGQGLRRSRILETTAERTRQPEVEQRDHALAAPRAQKDILRLEIPVHEPGLVNRRHSTTKRAAERLDVGRRHGPVTRQRRQSIGQRLAEQALLDEIAAPVGRDVAAIEGGHVGRPDREQGLRLALEPPIARPVSQLDRHLAPLAVPPGEDGGEAARTQKGQPLEVRQRGRLRRRSGERRLRQRPVERAAPRGRQSAVTLRATHARPTQIGCLCLRARCARARGFRRSTQPA
jgi:hypothetical protein